MLRKGARLALFSARWHNRERLGGLGKARWPPRHVDARMDAPQQSVVMLDLSARPAGPADKERDDR
jgi:hypothetical protein